MSVLEPSDAKQIAEMISWVVAEGDTLEIVAGGTKRALGRPMKTDHVLDRFAARRESSNTRPRNLF